MAQQAAPDLPVSDIPGAPPSLEQVESANPPVAGPDYGVAGSPGTGDLAGAEADQVQLEGPRLQGEEGTGLTGGPIGN